MNADQFIKAHGIEKAREVVEGAPYLNYDETHFCADVFVYTDGFDDDGYCQHCVDISDLKRLVDSLAFVDMGDDSHIENHISPNCKKFDERVK